jgi:hypothetical protein
MSIIKKSVGRGGTNQPLDVRVIKFLLNRMMPWIYPVQAVPAVADPAAGLSLPGAEFALLPPHERITEETIQTIKDFQERVCHLRPPDGLIEPGRNTIKKLAELFMADGGVVPITLHNAIRQIRPHSRYARHNVATYQGGFFETGQTVAGFDGRRLILSINPTETIFLLLDHAGPGDEFQELNPIRGRVGTIYKQTTDAFLGERDMMYLSEQAQRLEQGIARLQEFEINVTLGALSVLPGIGTAITVGDCTLLVLRHRQLLLALHTFIATYLRVRQALRGRARHFCEKLEAALLRGIGRGTLVAIEVFGDDVFENLGEAAQSPDKIGRLVGAIAGTAGQALVRRSAVLKVVLVLLKTLITKALGALPGTLMRAVAITAEEKLTSARTIIAHFQSIGVPTTLEEGQLIVQEILAHPAEIRGLIEDLAQAASAFQE